MIIYRLRKINNVVMGKEDLRLDLKNHRELLMKELDT